MNTQEFGPSNAQVIRWILVAFTVVLSFFALWLIRDIVLLTLMAIIFAILLTSPVRFFVRFGLPRRYAVLLTIALLIALVIVTVLLVLPALLDQLSILVGQTIPGAWNLLQKELEPSVLNERLPFLKRLGVNLNNLGEQLVNQIVASMGSITGQVFPFIGVLASTIISILVVVFLSLYFVADPDTHWRGMLRLFPIRIRPRVHEIFTKVDMTLRRYLQAQILIMLITGFATGTALGIIGVPLPGALGTITGLFSFVPNFGPVVALIPILAVALINTPDKIWGVIILFFTLQFIINQIFAPLLFGQEMHLPPALLLISQIVGGVFFGFLGLLLSVPLTAIGSVLVREIYIKDILGDREIGRRTQEMSVVKGKRPIPEPKREA